MTGINDLVSGVINRINDIPDSITGSPMIYEFLNDARIDVANYMCDTISETDIPEKYESILKNMGAAYTLSYMNGIGVDFDYSIGDFTVKKGNKEDPNSKQISFFLDQANRTMNAMCRDVNYKATFT